MASNKVAAVDGVLLKVGDRIVSLYRDAPVPEGADEAHVALLAERGLLVTPDSEDQDADGEFPADGSELEQDAWVANSKVADVLGYVKDYPETREAILAAEKRGKDRKSVVEPLSEGS